MRPESVGTFSTLFRVLRRPGMLGGMLASILIFSGHFAFFTYLRPFLETVAQASVEGVSLILLGFGVANFIGTSVASYLLSRSLRLTLALVPLMMSVLALLMVTFGHLSVLDGLLVALWGFAFGLVPVAWSGPVLAPCIISVGLISLGCTLLWRRTRFPGYRPRTGHWVSLGASAVLFLYTFLEEPVSYIRGAGGTLETMVGHRAMDALGAYVPEHYAWWVFLAACVLGGATLGMMLLGQCRATVGDP